MNFNTLTDFSQKHTKFILSLCKPLFKTFGVTQIHYVRVYNNGRVCAVNSNHEILIRWLKEDYYKTDSLLVSPSVIDNLLVPWNMKYYPGFNKEALRKLMVDSGINQGISFIQKDSLGYVNFSFGTSKDELNWLIRINNDAQNILEFVKHAQKKIEPILKKEYPNMINISEHKKDFFSEQHNTGVIIDKFARMDFLISTGIFNKSDEYLINVNLSYREIQCAKWYLEAKTKSEMCDETGLAPNTIGMYFIRLKKKLKAHSKHRLILVLKKIQMIGGLDVQKTPRNKLHSTEGFDVLGYEDSQAMA